MTLGVVAGPVAFLDKKRDVWSPGSVVRGPSRTAGQEVACLLFEATKAFLFCFFSLAPRRSSANPRGRNFQRFSQHLRVLGRHGSPSYFFDEVVQASARAKKKKKNNSAVEDRVPCRTV